MVIVLCNLKARSLAGYSSHGMVLCAEPSDRSSAELLQPPVGAVPGDLISFAGYDRRAPETLNVKKNPWDNVAPKLRIDEQGIAKYEDIPFSVGGKGNCYAPTLRNGEIH